MKKLIPLFIFLGLVLLLWRGLHNDSRLVQSPLIGKAVPAFQLASALGSGKIITENIFQNHVTVLNVFATWCLTCRAETSVLAQMAQDHVRMVGVDYKDRRVDLLTWIENYGNPYAAIIADSDGSLGINLGVYGTPETFIIDAQGIIRYKHVGAISPDVWQNELQPELKKLGPV